MRLSIRESVLHSNDGVAGLWALLAKLVERLLDGGHVLVRNVLPFGLVLEYVSQDRILRRNVLIYRLNVANDSRVLPSTARLLLVQVVEFVLSADRLTIIDSRVADHNINVVLALDSLTVNEQMELAHARYDDLLTLLVVVHCERRILTLEAGQRF